MPGETSSTIDRPNRRANLSSKELDGELIVLDREAGQVHQLNPAASLIWNCCDGDHALDDIARRLVDTFVVEAEVAARDVEEAVRELRSLGLLEPAT